MLVVRSPTRSSSREERNIAMCQVALERRHWEAAGRAEDVKKELERKHVDKVFFF